jgi:hypothetical protein
MFILQFILIIVGFITICISVVYIYIEHERLAEPFGLAILGFSLLLFGLALQLVDNKNIEQRGKEIGIERYQVKSEKERPLSNRLRMTPRSFGIDRNFEEKPKATEKISYANLFTKPNVSQRTVRGPKQSISNEPVKINQISKMIKNQPDKKKARKIRKAL